MGTNTKSVTRGAGQEIPQGFCQYDGATDSVIIPATGTQTGAVNETAPATDTASSGLNGRLQRIAQRLTSLIALLPASLGAKTSAASLSVTLASDQTLPAGENHIGQVGGTTARITATFDRPADTNIYASGDLVANNTTAGSVTPMSFAIGRVASIGGMIRRVRLRKTGTGVTNASFRLHLYSSSPTPSNGDNGAWLTNGATNYVGAMDVTVDKVFTDGAAGNGVPIIGSEINFTATTYYGLLEARGAYTPANGETFDLILEVLQN